MLETILFMVILADVVLFSAIMGYVKGKIILKRLRR